MIAGIIQILANPMQKQHTV
uniref:Uncharacterized protein n=1 Tax=Anguilla anguilla TaxID=7936 RepID=A0A0E9TMC5_ANGAN